MCLRNFKGFNLYDFLDLLDTNDGLYCPSIVLDIHVSESNKIEYYYLKYIGWTDSFNVKIAYADAPNLMFQRGTFVKEYKCWVNYGKLYPWWPSKVFVRDVKDRNKSGITFLKEESRILVIPYGNLVGILKQCKSGDWIESSQVEPFSVNSTKHIEIGMKTPTGKKKFESTLEFESALRELENDTSAELFDFKLVGTYEVNKIMSTNVVKPAINNNIKSIQIKYKMLLDGAEKIAALKEQKINLRKQGKDHKLFELMPVNTISVQGIFNRSIRKQDIMFNYSHMSNWNSSDMIMYCDQLSIGIPNSSHLCTSPLSSTNKKQKLENANESIPIAISQPFIKMYHDIVNNID